MKTLLALLLFVCSSSVMAQTLDSIKNVSNSETQVGNPPSTQKRGYKVVDEMPSFPGGTAALMQYLASNVRYPAEAQKKGVQGRPVIAFIVERDGSLSNFAVVSSVDPSLDKEALRVVSSMPKWKPGKNKGVPVRVKYNVPVSFKL